MKQTKSLCALVALLIYSTTQESEAAVIVVAPTSTTSGSLQITNDVTFTITISSQISTFGFDEWVTSDGNQSFSTFSPNLSISVNSTPTILLANSISENRATNSGAYTLNDGIIHLNSFATVVAGDTVTLLANTYTLAPVANFNFRATQTFTGGMFIADGFATRISNIVTVPEPSITGPLLGGITIMALRRSRK